MLVKQAKGRNGLFFSCVNILSIKVIGIIWGTLAIWILFAIYFPVLNFSFPSACSLIKILGARGM